MDQVFFKKLLDFYKIDNNDYLLLTETPNLETFAVGHAFSKMNEAVQLVKEVMANKGKIIVYGDYDCDGIMGTSILVKMFSYLNYVVDYYVPNRYKDGYGITLQKAKEFVISDYDLVITIDNGITAFEAISYLKENNVKVLILDHHERGETLPTADVILHPFVSNFGKVGSSGGFVAFMFSHYVLGYYDKYLAVLASISLISDMMPLLDYNRKLFRCVRDFYHIGEFKCIDLLTDSASFDEKVVGMKIAPKINSIGRLIGDESINELVRFFTTDDEEFLLNYFSYICEMNEKRKELSKEAVNCLEVNPKDEAIVLKLDIKEGLLGLVANSVVGKYSRPVIIFTEDSNGDILKGSARAMEGFNIVKTFQSLNKYMLTYGGHALAGGCSIKKEDFDSFKKDFIQLVHDSSFQKVEHHYIPLSLTEITKDNVELLGTFSPFGENWTEPRFILKRIKVDSLTYSHDKKHILASLGNETRLVGFNISRDDLSNYTYVDLVGTMSINVYRGFVNASFFIEMFNNSQK